jgi:hypothetical protein
MVQDSAASSYDFAKTQILLFLPRSAALLRCAALRRQKNKSNIRSPLLLRGIECRGAATDFSSLFFHCSVGRKSRKK